MSDDSDNETPHPRQTTVLFGHAAAEQALLDSYRSGRMPHAWLIGGPPSIGKSTLAFRLARFVLANPDPTAPAVQKASSLAVAGDNPAARRIANEAHPDLLLLRRTINEKTGKLYQDIIADEIRKIVPFFGSTAGEGGWRVAIVDSVDELNASGENALLKLLEEPPQRSLLLLISHSPGRLLPTIRSRCRMLLLRALNADEVAKTAAAALSRDPKDPAIVEAAAAAEGSVERALNLLEGPMLALRQKTLDLIGQLPNPDQRSLHALADAMAGTDPAPLNAFRDIVNGWLSAQLKGGAAPPAQLARVAKSWDEINAAMRESEIYNLDRRPVVFSVFRALAVPVRKPPKAR